MVGYLDDAERTAEVDARRLLPHRRRRPARRRRLHHLRRPHRRRVQGVRLPHQPVRAGERADRARGGGRGGGGAQPRPAAPGGAQGLRGAGGRATSPSRHGPLDPRVLPRAGWRPTSASGASSSPTCRRRSPARSAAWSCAGPSTTGVPPTPGTRASSGKTTSRTSRTAVPNSADRRSAGAAMRRRAEREPIVEAKPSRSKPKRSGGRDAATAYLGRGDLRRPRGGALAHRHRRSRRAPRSSAACPPSATTSVRGVRVGKAIRFAIDAADETAARAEVGELCSRFLTNPVIEDAVITVEPAS